MQRSGSQKILRIISFISIIGAIITILISIVLLAGGIFYSQNGTEAVEGMTAAEAGAASAMVGFFALIDGLVSLLMGILGLRAAKDSRKIMPVWIISALGLISSIVSLVVTLFSGNADPSQMGSIIGSFIGSGLMFWLANNIKKQNI